MSTSSQANLEFKLLGHDCPTGSYPSVVVPVGRIEDQLCVVYRTSSAAEVLPIKSGQRFVVYGEKTLTLLDGYDAQRDSLFALDEREVVRYRHSERERFSRELLRSSVAPLLNPFYRLSFALDTSEKALIQASAKACLKELGIIAPEVIQDWLALLRRQNPGVRIPEYRQPDPHVEFEMQPRYALERAVARSSIQSKELVLLESAPENRQLISPAMTSERIRETILSTIGRLTYRNANSKLRSAVNASVFGVPNRETPHPKEVAELSGLSLSLLELYKVILNKRNATTFLRETASGFSASYVRSIVLSKQEYESTFGRRRTQVNGYPVYTYSEIFKLVSPTSRIRMLELE